MQNNKTKAIDRFYLTIMLDAILAVIGLSILLFGLSGVGLAVLAFIILVTATCFVEFKASRL